MAADHVGDDTAVGRRIGDPVTTPADTGAGWSGADAPLGMDLDADRAADPYLAWAELSTYSGYDRASTRSGLPFLIELPSSIDADQSALTATQVALLRWILGVRAAGSTTRFVTQLIGGDLADLVALQTKGFVERFQLGAARGQPDRLLDVLESGHRAAPSAHTLGIVDDGCCFAHEGLRVDGGHSRFAYVWDQNPRAVAIGSWGSFRYEAGGSVQRPVYGVELDASRIEAQLSKGIGYRNETDIYTAIRRPRWGRQGRTHGAGVLHLAAGEHRRPATPTGGASGPVAPIIFVQLPDQTAADTSGGSLGFYVLDAVRYIVQRTREAAGMGDDWSTTVNISLGSTAGPHDGTTITERALDEIVLDSRSGDLRRVTIVLAAGNAAKSRIHAEHAVDASHPGRFFVMAPPGNAKESFVELWIPGEATGGEVPVDAFSIVVTSPDGRRSPSTGVGQAVVLQDARSRVQAAVVFARCVAQGLDGTMILLAIGATARAGDADAALAPYGVWQIEVASTASEAATLHAWVERNDTVIAPRRVQQTHFVDDDPLDRSASGINSRHTLSSIANGTEVRVVGAYDVRRGEATDFSSNGPVRSQEAPVPTLFGPGDFSATRKGIRVPGFFSGSRMTFGGTSAAAPRLTRWFIDGMPDGQSVAVATGAASRMTATPSLFGIAVSSDLDGVAEEDPGRSR